MELTETTESIDRGRDLKKVINDILEISSEALGLIASPSTLWVMVLWNCNGGKGFNGFVTNPQASGGQPPSNGGSSPPPNGGGTTPIGGNTAGTIYNGPKTYVLMEYNGFTVWNDTSANNPPNYYYVCARNSDNLIFESYYGQAGTNALIEYFRNRISQGFPVA